MTEKTDNINMYILTGVCASGKTAVQRRLAKLLGPERYACHDLDDIGLPDRVDAGWISDQVERWLQVACQNAARGRETVLSGFLSPGVAENSPSFSVAPPVRYCVLKAKDAVLTERLHDRFSAQDRRAECQRVTGMSPDALLQTILTRQSAFLGWFSESNCDWVELDTSHATLDDTVQLVMKWMGIRYVVPTRRCSHISETTHGFRKWRASHVGD